MTSYQAPFYSGNGSPLNPTPPNKPPDCGVDRIANDETMFALGSQRFSKDMLLGVEERVATMELED